LAGALALSLNQTPGTPKAPAVRFHHLHFQTDDSAGALTAAAGTLGGVRTILEGLGPGVGAGDVYLLFERPPDNADDRASERRESAASRIDATAEWLRMRGIDVSVSDAARRIINGPTFALRATVGEPAGDAPLDHVALLPRTLPLSSAHFERQPSSPCVARRSRCSTDRRQRIRA
jgi:hypothetical protein